jgi:RNA polymerase sigma factor (sigma-70 family)
MASRTVSTVLERIRKLAAVRSSRERTDRELLERFIAANDEAAFTVLVERHGPLVLGVCRRILGNAQDAEDACQATFLVLARKSTSIRKTASLGSWLHGVAARVAANLRRQRRRRAECERAGQCPAAPDPAAEVSWREAHAALDEELGRLPEQLRAPLVLCYLDGRTRDEAARDLGLSLGCLHGRLERARKLLSDRLTRRGLTLSAALFAANVGVSTARAGLAPTAVVAVTRAAVSFARGQLPAADAVSPGVLTLTRKAMMPTLPAKPKLVALLALFAGAVLLGAGGALAPAGPAREAKAAPSLPAKGRPARVEDARALQGAWWVVEAEVDGKKAATEELPDLRMVFEGDRLTLGSADGEGRTRAYTFTLDAGKSPREMVLSERDGPNKGTVTRVIYALEKGRLRLGDSREGGKHPTDFKTRKGDGMVVLVLERVGTKGAGAAPPRRPSDEAGSELRAILIAAQRAREQYWDAFGKARTPDQRRQAQDAQQAKLGPLAERCLKLARTHPDRPAALTALFWAATNAAHTAAGKEALALLGDGRVARADPEEMFKAIQLAGPYDSAPPSLAPAVLECVRKKLDHPRAARLLTWVCASDYRQGSAEVPLPFAEAAELIVSRFAASPDIYNFCESLAPLSGTPPRWAGKYEPGLRAILAKNRHRLVRLTAHFALASVINSAGAAREDEVVKLFEQLLKDFDGSDPTIGVERDYLRRARAELEEIRFRAVGRPVPEVRGEDLDGRPMHLAEFRGKVVLVSFWATTCFPCMKRIPHERALVERLKGKPFVLVGVNCDTDQGAVRKALKTHRVTWRSFRDRRPGKPAISHEWSILGYPTLYLIDHAGIIRQRWIGAPPPEELNRAIDRLVEAAARKE